MSRFTIDPVDLAGVSGFDRERALFFGERFVKRRAEPDREGQRGAEADHSNSSRNLKAGFRFGSFGELTTKSCAQHHPNRRPPGLALRFPQETGNPASSQAAVLFSLAI
jgi:hypothetical protein